MKSSDCALLPKFAPQSEPDPVVSVIMPVFNEKPDFLEKAIKSVLNQTFKNFEFIVLDDATNEEATLQVLHDYKERDRRLRLTRLSKCGYTRALNFGLGQCRGEFICRQDSDDWSEPTRVERQMTFLKENPHIVLVGTNALLHQENGKPLWKTKLPLTPDGVIRAFWKGNPFCHGAVCFRQTEARAVGGYRNDLEPSEDYDLFWRLCERGKGANLPEALYHLRRKAGSVSISRRAEQIRKHHMVRKLAEMRSQGKNEDLHLAARAVENSVDPFLFDENATRLSIGDHFMLAGHYRQAGQIFLKGIFTQPMRLKGYLKMIRLTLFVLVPLTRRYLFQYH